MEYLSFVASYLFARHEPRDSLDGKRTKIMSKQQRAAAVGVDAILDVTADVPHVFQSFAGWLDEVDAALDRAGRFVLDRLAPVPAVR